MGLIISDTKPQGLSVGGSKAYGMAIDGKKVWQYVPSNPKRFALISTRGPYISTNFIPNVADDRVKITTRICFTQTHTTTAVYAEGRETIGNRISYGIDKNNAIRISAGDVVNKLTTLPKFVLSTWYTYILESGIIEAGVKKCRLTITKDDGTTFSEAITYTTSSPIQSYQSYFFLFAKSASNDCTGGPHPVLTGLYMAQKKEYCTIECNGVIVRDMVAVPQGDTTYSSTPAPSNCMWEKISCKYHENLGAGAFTVEELV